MLTEEQGEEAHCLYEEVADAIDDLVTSMLAGKPSEVKEYVRNVLGDTYRFWE